MIGSFKFDTGIQNIVILLILVGIGIFLYLEMRKITIDLDRIKKRVDDISRKKEGFGSLEGTSPSVISPMIPSQPSQIFQHSVTEATEAKTKESKDKTKESLRSLMMSSDSPNAYDTFDISNDFKEDETSFEKSIPESEPAFTDLEVGIPSSHDSAKDVVEPIRDVVEPIRDVVEPIRDVVEPIREEPLREEPLREEPIKESGFSEDIKIITQDQDPYQAMTVSELKAVLQEKGLPLSGNKTKLINRIKENVNVEKK